MRLPDAYRLFNHFAPLYEWLVDNTLWRESLREMARHLPPSGVTLRLLDAGCGPANSARQMASLRPDVQVYALDASRAMVRRAQRAVARDPHWDRLTITLANAQCLPFPANSMDAVMAHSVYYMLDDQPAYLSEVLRVLRPGGRLIMLDPAKVPYPLGVLRKTLRAAPSVLTWQAVSRAYHRYTPEQLARELEQAGFARVLGEQAVEGYGVLSRGEKPYPILSTVERIAVTADQDSGVRIDSRHVFLLIRQTPDKPVWTLSPEDVVTWGAATVLDRGIPTALAFTSLPKAVAFMQTAVTANLVIGVSKVAKYPRSAAETWDFPWLLNPSLEALRADPRYTLPGPYIGVDPAAAIQSEE